MVYYRTPSSSANPSPSSSPAFGPVDSSPLSSPSLQPIVLDSPPATPGHVLHPFAASTKANRRPPQYEKKLETPPVTPPQAFTSKPSLGYYRVPKLTHKSEDDDFFRGNGSPISSSFSRQVSRNLSREEQIWDDALEKPFSTGIGAIDLSNQQLTYIPPSIADLSNFFNTSEKSEQVNIVDATAVRSFSRVSTGTESSSSRTRSFGRIKSIVESGKERHELQLYLSGNQISNLPRELFSLQKMTVLILRGNLLTSIPSDISHLSSLRELNISNNKLTYLPSELCEMPALDKLYLNPNPFLQEPSRSVTHRKEELARPPTTAVSSASVFVPSIPPLSEMCYRKLLTPISSFATTPTVLSEYYGVPLSEWWEDCIPSNIRETLGACVPGTFKPHISLSPTSSPSHVRSRKQSPYVSVGVCPNPKHRGSVFIKHAEERFTWERVISGVDVGGSVPVRWRGCLRGCLDFLVQNDENAVEAENSPASGHDADTELNSESDVDSLMAVDDEMDAIQVVKLDGNMLAMDEFED
ncbi:hypothetical protein SERLADRAFT_417754 [Serpula lacrymans var. lacrymans S7.9]|uniref:Uncharacterized protein n=1 Tax=Serpula lacrymans var. lacrymans (strain S7.9) TaxID=578457 RepID=F8P7W9_SERL9|nr:uncharacterized protein SERLADRAFT_417754 [Serpula lacrymans var. lacrymans S7.9]EGO20527.1 hypothetical protein SERLADRAFT_417754 [Serpula lacrymans var. lacrymans S7.9]